MKRTVALLENKRKIVVLGEMGSGKSELALNLAFGLNSEVDDEVCLFDMDQTKAMFRIREQAGQIRAAGITFMLEAQFMDAPTIPPGVRESLANPGTWTIMDVGGSAHGAYCIGQFAEAVTAADALVLYTINPYRAFSNTTERIAQTLGTVCNCAGLHDVRIVCNPFLGADTTSDDVVKGHAALERLLAPLGLEILFDILPNRLWLNTSPRLPGRALAIKPYLRKISG